MKPCERKNKKRTSLPFPRSPLTDPQQRRNALFDVVRDDSSFVWITQAKEYREKAFVFFIERTMLLLEEKRRPLCSGGH